MRSGFTKIKTWPLKTVSTKQANCVCFGENSMVSKKVDLCNYRVVWNSVLNLTMANSLATRECCNDFKSVIFKLVIQNCVLSTCSEITLRPMPHNPTNTWWRHQMETYSTLLALCAGNSPITGKFRSQRPVTQGIDIFFDLRLNKRLSKQSRRRWLRHHRAHYDVTVMETSTLVQIMAWCHQATSRYPSQYWPRSMSLGYNKCW